MRVRIGCSGWSYDEWRGPLYARDAQPHTYLSAYARVFDVVEINSTFYRPPTREDAARWDAATPKGFLFLPKIPQAMSHDAKLRGVAGLAREFVDALDPLRKAGKLGPVLLQLPPSFRAEEDADALAEFLAAWPREVALAVELRHSSWWSEATYALLREHRASLCWSTNEYGRTPPVATAGTVYARMIGDRALDKEGVRWDREQRAMPHELQRLREEMALVRGIASEAFVIANNHFTGFAPAACQRIAEAVGMPAFDLAAAARAERQRGLGQF